MITIILTYLTVSVTLGALMEYGIRESGQTVSALERAALVLATPFLLTWLLIEFLRGSL